MKSRSHFRTIIFAIIFSALFSQAVFAGMPSAKLEVLSPFKTKQDSKIKKIKKIVQLYSFKDKLIIKFTQATNQKLFIKSSDIYLYLNGMRIDGIHPEIYNSSININTLVFELMILKENRLTWAKLYRRADNKNSANFEVTLGTKEGKTIGVKTTFKINFHKVMTRVMMIGLAILYLIIYIAIAYSTNLLRETPLPEYQDENIKMPYSLAKVQWFIWLFFITLSFLFIFGITGATNLLPLSMLILMGISTGTAVSGLSISLNKKSKLQGQIDKLKRRSLALAAEKGKLNERLLKKENDLKAKIELEYKERELIEIEGKLKSLRQAAKPRRSKWFIPDILSDANGISIYRTQFLIWTAVILIVFITSVIKDWSIPNLSDELLGLMGISSAGYLGMKIPEKNNK